MRLMEKDWHLWVNTFEKNMDRVLKGAVFFVGKLLWSQERIGDNHPLNLILQCFHELILQTNKFSVLNEVLTATKMLVVNREIQLFFEWETVLAIVDTLTPHIELLNKKKRIDSVYDIFKVVKNQLLLEKFPDMFTSQALKVYLKYKSTRAITDKTLTQMAIDHLMKNDLEENFQGLIESCLVNERSAEMRSMFLDKVKTFYADQEGNPNTCPLLEAVFSNNLEQFYLTRKEGSFSTQQIIEIIDILTLMAH